MYKFIPRSPYILARLVRPSLLVSPTPPISTIAANHRYSIRMPTPHATPIPVILCGKSAEMAKNVTEALLPEIEDEIVIHVFLSPTTFITTAPLILKNTRDGNDKLSLESNIGSQDYSKTVLAIVAGAGFGDGDIELMREASRGKDKGIKGVLWLRPDLERERPPLGPEYGKFVVRCVKECLAGLKEQGKLAEGSGVYYY